MEKIFFIGDDFTGASDNAAQYSRHGLRTVLLFYLPDIEILRQLVFDNDVVGIATTTRSMSPEGITEELTTIFSSIQKLKISIVQYKCCSTFDSSNSTGNLAVALQLMRNFWPDSFSPIYIATPEFGRYTIFSNHYAVFNNKRYRLDRHPVMAQHPVTPMYEADIRIILKQQGFHVGGSMDLIELDQNIQDGTYEVRNDLDSMVFDGYTLDHSKAVAKIVLNKAERRMVTALAAQGFAEGLGSCLADKAEKGQEKNHHLPETDKILVLSGSCSMTSKQQIEYAKSVGFCVFQIQPLDILGDGKASLGKLIKETIDLLNAGKSVILYTALGQEDPAINELNRLMTDKKVQIKSSEIIGKTFGLILQEVLKNTNVSRLVIAGGDCSSYAMREMMVQSIEMTVSHFLHNAHMGLVRSINKLINGKEFLLKGGQVGRTN